MACVGRVCSLYGVCAWPAWGCADAAPVSCRQLQFLPAQSPTGPQPQTHLSKTPWCTPPPPSRARYRYPPPTPRCESCRAKGARRKTLRLRMQSIESGTSAPASLVVWRFSRPRCQEKPSSKTCWAEIGRPPRVHCYPSPAMMVRSSTGCRLPPRTRGTWGRRRPRKAWPAKLPRPLVAALAGFDLRVLVGVLEALASVTRSRLRSAVLHLCLANKLPACMVRNNRPSTMEPYLRRLETGIARDR